MSQKVVLPMDVFNKLVEYVGQKPYNEVSSIIDEIRQTAQVVQDKQITEVEEETADE